MTNIITLHESAPTYHIVWSADWGYTFADGHYSDGEFCENTELQQDYGSADTALDALKSIYRNEFGGDPLTLNVAAIVCDVHGNSHTLAEREWNCTGNRRGALRCA